MNKPVVPLPEIDKFEIVRVYIVVSDVFVEYLMNNDMDEKWKEQVKLSWIMVSNMLKDQMPEA